MSFLKGQIPCFDSRKPVELSVGPLDQTVHSLVEGIPTSQSTKAYVEGLFLSQARPSRIVDLSNQSVVLATTKIQPRDLLKTQELADWILWMLSWFPSSVGRDREVVETLGRMHYNRCYRLVPSWKTYEELAEMLPIIVHQVHARVDRLTW